MKHPKSPLVSALTGAAIAGLLVVGPATTGAGAERTAPARRLHAPEHITAGTQAELNARMGRHGEVMANLVRAVVLLDRPTIRLLAGRIADEEVIAHATRPPHEPLPLSLPRDFFLQQTKLAVAARDLAAAVVDGAGDAVLGDRFAAVTSTCIGCHSAYLHGQPDAVPPDAAQNGTKAPR